MAYPATPKTWVAGDVLTAAQLNAELRDALLGAFPLGVGAWTSYTPTLTQSGAVTKTVTYAKYQRVGRLIHATWSLAVTGTGTGVNVVTVSLPVTAAAAVTAGSGFIFDSSASLHYGGIAVLNTTTTCQLLSTSTDTTVFLGGAVFTAALAAGDVVTGSVTYESAA